MRLCLFLLAILLFGAAPASSQLPPLLPPAAPGSPAPLLSPPGSQVSPPLAAAPAGGPPLVLDAAALPMIWPKGRLIYEQRFLLGNLSRAFAIGTNGEYGGMWGASSLEEARAEALRICGNKGGTDCAVYAADLNVVWNGRAQAAAPPPPGPLLAGDGWAFVPDARYFWYGPAAARGVGVFAHGYSGSASRTELGEVQPPPFLRAFNNAGFDVVRFARAWRVDGRTDEMARHLREGLRDLHRRGWKSVIAAGQSRGGWNVLQTLDTPGIADAVIATSPAAAGTDPGAPARLGNRGLEAIVGAARSPHTRVVFAQFADDPFYVNGDERAAIIRRLQGRIAAVMIIDRPADIAGHDGANGAVFAERYGACLLRFTTAPTVPSSC